MGKTNRSESNKKNQFFTLLGISTACYLPAFVLILLNFYLVRAIHPSSPILLEPDRTEFEVSKIKSDLFSQISFPVIFSIASIFAAFAVKDIIAKFLEEDQKKSIIDELEKKLNSETVPDAVEEYQKKVQRRLKKIELEINHLEYEVLNNSINQIFNNFSGSQVLEDDLTKEFVKSFGEISERKVSRMLRIAPYLGQSRFKEWLHNDAQQIKSHMRRLSLDRKLSSEVEKAIDSRVELAIAEKNLNRDEPEKIYSRSDSIFEMNLNLFITTLISSSVDPELIRGYIKKIKSIKLLEEAEIEQRSQIIDNSQYQHNSAPD